MDIVKVILLILHVIGIASLLGSFIVQLKPIARGEGKMLTGMLHGALTMLVTGLLLVLVNEFDPAIDVNHAKVGIKLVLLVAVLVLVLVFRKRDPVPSWVMWLIGGLTTANIVIAFAV